MMNTLLLATSEGLAIASLDGDSWTVTRRALEGTYITSLTAQGDFVLAGIKDGIYRSSDLGQTWTEANEGLSIPHVRWLASHPDLPALKFAGTEPAGIFLSEDSGQTWRASPEVHRLRDEHGWFLPYSPESGCVRGFAFHGQRGYAAVEVGGVLRTNDSGGSWALAKGSTGVPGFSGVEPGFIHPDVHSIEVHTSSPDLVFAPTNSGLFRSTNGGDTWELINDPGYNRAVWLDPDDPNHLVAGPARGVDRDGSIQQTHNGGRTWETITDGTDAPWPRHMVERFTQAGDKLLAVLSNGELYAASLANLDWRRVLSQVGHVHAVAVLPG